MNEFIAIVLKTVRKANNLTQAELAEELGITPGHVGSLEQGKTKPSYDVMQVIVTKYDIDANLFFGRTQKDVKTIDENTIQYFQNLLSNVSERMWEYKRSVDKAYNEENE